MKFQITLTVEDDQHAALLCRIARALSVDEPESFVLAFDARDGYPDALLVSPETTAPGAEWFENAINSMLQLRQYSNGSAVRSY